MKPISRLFAATLFSAGCACAAEVGDTYPQVLAEKGAPKSQMQAGSVRMLTYGDSVIKFRDDIVVSIRAVAAEAKPTPTGSSEPAKPLSHDAQVSVLKAQLDDAVARVKRIVNQEVTPIPRDPKLALKTWYFHDGATRPEFNNVDIRATQEKHYEEEGYICWAEKPDVMWDGRELEFNAMTKYFYVDRTLPKKRLTEAEMLEINRLYRVIGSTEQKLAQLGYKGVVP